MSHAHGCGCGSDSPLVSRFADAVAALTRRDLLAGAALATVAAAAPRAFAEPAAATTAETIFHGGPILTMAKDGERAEALAVAGGKILRVGTLADVMATKGPGTRVVDLAGKCLMPGFVDAHSHVVAQSLKFATVNLDPKPIGDIASIADVQRALRETLERTKPAPGTWILGWGYDDTGLAEMRHPDRDDLDAVSKDHPILLMHISSHLATGNSKMLEAAGIGPDTPDPAGGRYQRRPDGKTPNGVIEEGAMFAAFTKVPTPSPEQALGILERGAAAYAAAGITTAQEGAASPTAMTLLRAMDAAGKLPIDVVAYPLHTVADDATLDAAVADRGATRRVRVGGVKLVVDGSIQGYTAYLSKPYHVPPGGKPACEDACGAPNRDALLAGGASKAAAPAAAPTGDRGYPNMTQEDVTAWLRRCDARGVQLLAHTNGDAATDMLLAAVRDVRGAKPRPDLRTTIIHAQTIRDDQLDVVAAHGLVPSFFPIHVYFWGDRHRDLFLGPERAARISPARSARDRGIRYTLHHDAPVAGIDMLKVAWASTNRLTTGGKELGPEQRVSAYEALRAVTADAAWQYFEEDVKGTLEAGKRADLVILSGDPIAHAATMKDLTVLETIKDGRTIFRAS